MASRILLIGGTGLLGPAVLAGLRELSPATEVFVLNRRGAAIEGATAFPGDRHDPKVLRAAVDAARPEVIIDMIPFTPADAEATVVALRVAEDPVRVVAVSSADVYAAFSRLNGLIGGPPETGAITEESPLRDGQGAQGADYDKLGVERAYAAAVPDFSALRLPAVYGWPDRMRIRPYADQMLDGAEEIALHPDLARWRFSRMLSRNAGWAVALAALRAPSGQHVWNVAEPVAPSEAEWVGRIAEGLGWRGRIVESAAAEAPCFRADQPIILSDARIRAELGYSERVDPQEGLADNLRRYADNRGSRPAG